VANRKVTTRRRGLAILSAALGIVLIAAASFIYFRYRFLWLDALFADGERRLCGIIRVSLHG
jgi:hypothetical protein